MHSLVMLFEFFNDPFKISKLLFSKPRNLFIKLAAVAFPLRYFIIIHANLIELLVSVIFLFKGVETLIYIFVFSHIMFWR